jgi:1,4-alpha-glucan branching enzyme
VDAVASMLYLDYSRNDGEWIPNKYGGNENLEAVSFLKEFNETVYREYPDAVTIAEESTSWTGVSRPTYTGGLGFGQKWMMGWMHDTLNYFKRDPVYRKYHHDEITFSLVYGFSENFMLPLSHDEVVHGKGPIIDRMPGDEWQKFANLRLMYSYMFAHPGTNLLFMGNEVGQRTEWSIEKGVEWALLDEAKNKGIQTLIKDLNQYYKTTGALYRKQFSADGFEWVAHQDRENSLIAFIRKGNDKDKPQLVVCNFTPTVKEDFKVGVTQGGLWKEVLNTDKEVYGGSGVQNEEKIKAEKKEWHGKSHHLKMKIPPLATLIFEPVKLKSKKAKATTKAKKSKKA